MALSILAVRVQPELKGQAKKSWVCSVAESGVPTGENWKSHFIGYRLELKARVLGQFDAWGSFGGLEREIEAQRQFSSHPAQENVVQGRDDFDYGYGYPEEI